MLERVERVRAARAARSLSDEQSKGIRGPVDWKRWEEWRAAEKMLTPEQEIASLRRELDHRDADRRTPMFGPEWGELARLRALWRIAVLEGDPAKIDEAKAAYAANPIGRRLIIEPKTEPAAAPAAPPAPNVVQLPRRQERSRPPHQAQQRAEQPDRLAGFRGGSHHGGAEEAPEPEGV